MYILLIGAYYTDNPHSFLTARTLKDAHALLRGYGYSKKEHNKHRGEKAYYENDKSKQWIRVILQDNNILKELNEN